MSQSLAPFSCTYTREVPDILAGLNCSLVLTTYQAGKVILISPKEEGLVQLARNFRKPMGMAVGGGRLAVATQHEVVVLENAPALATGYPKKPRHYDAFFVPRAVYFTGELDLHDMAWSGETLWAVNTLFSCLCRIGPRYSFEPMWRPPFVSALAPEDRCHLNGLAIDNRGEPVYVTALGATDEAGAWRADRLGGGVLVHVPSGEVALRGLAMPHSPRLYDGRLYFVLAARGELAVADPEAGTYEVVSQVPGFARGLARCGDYLFVAHSRLRKKHVFGDLPIAQGEHYAGVVVVHAPSGRIAGALRYHTACEEIYDVHALPDVRRPGLLGVESDVHRHAVLAPEGGYWTRTSEQEAAAQERPT